MIAEPVKDRAAPEHSKVDERSAASEPGTVFSISISVVAEVLPQAFVAVRVYMPADAVFTVMAAGLRSAEEYPSGPVHENASAPIAEPLSVTVLPLQARVADIPATTLEGAAVHPASIVIVALSPVTSVLHLAIEVALSMLYVVVVAGDTVTVFIPLLPIMTAVWLPPVQEKYTVSPVLP